MEVRPALAPDPIPTPAVRDPWARVLARIETKVNRHTFYTWWRETVLVEDRGDVLVVRAANERDKHDIIAAWIEKHYAELLAEALAAVRSGARVEFLFAIRQASVQQRKSG